MKKHLKLVSFLIGIIAVFIVSMTAWNAVVIRDFYVFVHSRGNSDIKPGTGKTYDEINLQSGIDKAQQQGRQLHTFGNEYFTTIGVAIDDYNQQLIWEGGGIYLTDIDGGTNALIRSKTTPPDNSDANIRVERHPVFRNINLKGSSGNIGIDIGPSYGAVYENIRGRNLKSIIHTRFGLMSQADNIFSTYCDNIITFGIGNWTGATWSNSQSNSSIATNIRGYFGTSTGAAIKIEHSSGIILNNIIIEGGSVNKGIEMYAPNNTVVKDLTIRNLHFECVNGANTAVIYARWAAGIITLDKAFGQYASILADVASTPGYTQVTISNIPYWVLKNGKGFNNGGNTSWKFINCDNPLFGDQPLSLFTGIAVRSGCNTGGGPNQVCITPINR